MFAATRPEAVVAALSASTLRPSQVDTSERAERHVAGGFEPVSAIAYRVIGRLLERERLGHTLHLREARRPKGPRLALINALVWTAWRCWNLAEELRRGA